MKDSHKKMFYLKMRRIVLYVKNQEGIKILSRNIFSIKSKQIYDGDEERQKENELKPINGYRLRGTKGKCSFVLFSN